MNPAVSLSRRRALASALALAVAACSLSRPSPVKSTYLLEPPAPSNKSATPGTATLKVEGRDPPSQVVLTVTTVKSDGVVVMRIEQAS